MAKNTGRGSRSAGPSRSLRATYGTWQEGPWMSLYVYSGGLPPKRRYALECKFSSRDPVDRRLYRWEWMRNRVAAGIRRGRRWRNAETYAAAVWDNRWPTGGFGWAEL